MRKVIPLIVVFLVLGLSDARAELTKEDLKEIRQIVREEISQVEKRLDQRIDDVEKRLGDLKADMEGRFSDINTYLQTLMTMLGVFMGLFGIFGVAFVVGWVKVSSKVAANEVTVTEHLKEEEKRAAGKERLIVQQQEEIRQIKDLRGAFQDLREEVNRRFERLEKRAA